MTNILPFPDNIVFASRADVCDIVDGAEVFIGFSFDVLHWPSNSDDPEVVATFGSMAEAERAVPRIARELHAVPA